MRETRDDSCGLTIAEEAIQVYTLMAEIFMQNLIQDFFPGRTKPQESYGEYMCIG